MDTPDPIPNEPRPRGNPLVRLWLVSLLLFAGGFVGKLVMEGGKPPDQGYPGVMMWQMGWYAAGLVVWLWWCNTQARGWKWGYPLGLAFTLAALLAVCSSSPK